ncbi:MAG: CcoQ/FixQ family Cbb3-type cytochrome c oxidase assembly chaperone [Flavobacteriales bacterium]
MLKFIKGHLDSISGIEIYPIISLLIFFTVFTVMLVWAFRADKKYLEEMSNLPLDNKNENI